MIVKAIENYPNYSVSDCGKVLNKYGKVLKTENCSGYHRVKLYNRFGCRKVLVHRIVIETFNPISDSTLEVNHINEVKTDNRISNLEWVTRKENVKHSLSKWCRDYSLISPLGVVFTGRNLKEFCKEQGLHQGHMNDVMLGVKKHYKNWKKI